MPNNDLEYVIERTEELILALRGDDKDRTEKPHPDSLVGILIQLRHFLDERLVWNVLPDEFRGYGNLDNTVTKILQKLQEVREERDKAVEALYSGEGAARELGRLREWLKFSSGDTFFSPFPDTRTPEEFVDELIGRFERLERIYLACRVREVDLENELKDKTKLPTTNHGGALITIQEALNDSSRTDEENWELIKSEIERHK